MWTNEKCLILISLYSERVLWDPKYEQYFSRHKKEDAWRNISMSMEIDVEKIRKKMTSLLGSSGENVLKRKLALSLNLCYFSPDFYISL
nr:unnamed protein product [Callosobruchus chinensis]